MEVLLHRFYTVSTPDGDISPNIKIIWHNNRVLIIVSEIREIKDIVRRRINLIADRIKTFLQNRDRDVNNLSDVILIEEDDGEFYQVLFRFEVGKFIFTERFKLMQGQIEMDTILNTMTEGEYFR